MKIRDMKPQVGIFEIVDGLSFTDRIAFPDETVQVGMNASETSFVPENLDSLGDNTGMEPSEEALGGPDA